MAKSLRDKVIALAGITQAALLVDQVAHTGEAEPMALQASIGSLFEFDPDHSVSTGIYLDIILDKQYHDDRCNTSRHVSVLAILIQCTPYYTILLPLYLSTLNDLCICRP